MGVVCRVAYNGAVVRRVPARRRISWLFFKAVRVGLAVAKPPYLN
jgi:hypothetical protein